MSLFYKPSASSAFSDSFESGISGYAGDTASFETTTTRAFDGSKSVTKASGAGGTHHFIYHDSDVFSPSASKTASVRVYRPDDGGNYRSGLVLLDRATNDGYVAYARSNKLFKLFTVTGLSFDTELASTSGFVYGEWSQITLKHDGANGLTAKLFNESGTELASITATDSTTDPNTLGLEMFDEGLQHDLLKEV